MADITPVHQAIYERLEAALAVSGMQLADGKIEDGEQLPKLASTWPMPHAVLYLGDDDPVEWWQDISETGAVNSLGILPFTVLCVANRGIELSQVRDIVVRSLVGWTPTTDCSQIQKGGAIADPPVPGVLKPQRFMRALSFYLTIGAKEIVNV